jgi:CMP-N,N'-diacetyllegionaminic acid synthase
MKNLCTICMREGSKGVPNKNFRALLGKPLMAYTIEKAIESKLFEHVVVSTDSEKIAETAKSFGAEAWFLRPPELAKDETPKLPVIRHAVLESVKHFGHQFDILTDLDATSPLREVEDLKGAYRQFVDEDSDVLITGNLARKNPYFNMVEINDGSVNLVKHTDLTKLLISPKASIHEALSFLGKSGGKCLMVVDLNRKLLGTLSDGDLRRAVLNGAVLGQAINNIYNRSPICMSRDSYKNKHAKKIFLDNKFALIPIIDAEGILLDFVAWEEVLTREENILDPPRNLRMNIPSRRQDAPEVYDMNASIYIWKCQALLESNTLFTEKTSLYVMPAERSIDIDTELDWDFVEFIMLRTMKNND